MPTILAIESSCDDTSAAIIKNGKILANITATQKVHEKWGGVVPELASRAHQQNIVVTVEAALKTAGVVKSELDAIAFTRGPGLAGALLVGMSFAKGMALALNKPLIAVHHMRAHVMANFIGKEVVFPHLCLTVSGGHTQLVRVDDFDQMEVIGETIDDAAGEAFDKTAKLLGLPYPGGPAMDQLAKSGNPKAFPFAEPQLAGLSFSFSGFKTSVLYFLQKATKSDPLFIEKNKADLCASIQHQIVAMLLKKTEAAIRSNEVKALTLAGGVSANSELRERFTQLGEKYQLPVFIPAFEYCTDNAAMIAMAAHHQYLKGEFATQQVEILPRWDL
ncbi:MAG: tRNA (adenosine(37)-N6)-threonylcarbamoyltransferase complex transferase subunit TsaD [Chitinophagales bacterium]